MAEAAEGRFAGRNTLEERIPVATGEELRALVSVLDTEALRAQFGAVIDAARKELSRRCTHPNTKPALRVPGLLCPDCGAVYQRRPQP